MRRARSRGPRRAPNRRWRPSRRGAAHSPSTLPSTSAATLFHGHRCSLRASRALPLYAGTNTLSNARMRRPARTGEHPSLPASLSPIRAFHQRSPLVVSIWSDATPICPWAAAERSCLQPCAKAVGPRVKKHYRVQMKARADRLFEKRATGRATCRKCGVRIVKGEGNGVRVCVRRVWSVSTCVWYAACPVDRTRALGGVMWYAASRGTAASAVLRGGVRIYYVVIDVLLLLPKRVGVDPSAGSVRVPDRCRDRRCLAARASCCPGHRVGSGLCEC